MKNDLIERFLKGDRQALARIISLVENGTEEGRSYYDLLFHRLGKAQRIGITGPPGVGKSTLVGKLIQHLREKRMKTGVVAIDPSSPFTGGAFLGDRVRMGEFAFDREVFVRSLATRGTSGGLSRMTKEVCDLLDIFGKEVILIETVGVGQSELEIARTADTTVVVLVPESGDSIQALKAGLMEIGDIFCINKSDRNGADVTAQAIREILRLVERRNWNPPVVKTVATEGEGLERLLGEIENHRRYLTENGLLEVRRRERVKAEIERMVEEGLKNRFLNEAGRSDNWEQLVESILKGETTPQKVADRIIEKILKKRR